ncbi:class I SAM-dependent methyltransferase [Paucibacter sp. Y2R2-4]|uniref:class I SAM-dependent methyltransferase n=1 Tax=Paucibacter sp. Y2R2-4 TaxID=2893553 RepID=UPI0021E4F1F9|nr:class I SAM-dependent methyltransferase [Paucibacter sp. Y2R2-4]MCV2351395.1 class I SAM-dependent methyltransferase [Paucibacter sp. Y2R2-4]
MPPTTQDSAYTDRLVQLPAQGWKKRFNVQAPYRWNLRRLDPGFTLEIGCGIGRMLSHLDGNGVGLDHNATSVAYARKLGLQAFTPDEFKASQFASPHCFDSLLLAHVAEHMTRAQLVPLITEYLSYLRPGAKIILITPQEAGFASDPTHVEFMDLTALRAVAAQLDCPVVHAFSFPFPRWVGRFFTYNEFVLIAIHSPASSEQGEAREGTDTT